MHSELGRLSARVTNQPLCESSHRVTLCWMIETPRLKDASCRILGQLDLKQSSSALLK